MRSMLHVGLTGNIGSGKSTASAMFAEFGAHIMDADKIVHRLLMPGSKVYDAVKSAFGAECLNSDGTIDRRRLGKIIFENPEKRNLLNTLIHPAVRTEILGRLVTLEQEVGSGVAIVDAALMVETGFYRLFEKIIVVACDPALQLSRVMARDGLSEAEARARIASQMPMAEKMKVAHYRIDTSGTRRETRNQVEVVYRDLLTTEHRLRSHGSLQQ